MFSSLSIKGKFLTVLGFFSLGFFIVLILSVMAGQFEIEVSTARKLVFSLPVGLGLASILGSSIVVNGIWRKVRLLNRLVPNINGKYRIETTSNWPQQKAMLDCINGLAENQSPLEPSMLAVTGELDIKQSLFRISINYKPEEISDSKTRYSVVVSSSLVKCENTELWSLYYVFYGKTNHPQSTDVPEYHGAAKLDIEVVNGRVEILIGHYWTNRSWQEAINTAGEIHLVSIEI